MGNRNKFTFGLLHDSSNFVAKENKKEKKELEKLDLKKINQVDFPSNQYYRKPTKKNQIVLHHTVSGQGVDGDINWWLKTSSRIATHIIIDWEGNIYQCYSSKYWGHHLGVSAKYIKKLGTKKSNKFLNKHSIAIEIDSWGGLMKHNNKWYPAKWDKRKRKNIPNITHNPIENIQKYPKGFKGFFAFEKYTDAQINSVRKLLKFWESRYDIPLDYNDKMWDVNKDALNGNSGVWTHVSYRPDKSDCHPQPELIDMLKSL